MKSKIVPAPRATKTIALLLCLGGSFLITSTSAQLTTTQIPAHLPGQNPGETHVRFYKDSPVPQAVVLSLNGECQYSLDGLKFQKAKVGDLFEEGTLIRTGKDARVDLFLRRLAITIRLTSETDLALETMAVSKTNGLPAVETILNLRAGQIFCFVRGLVPNSRFEVKHAVGRSVVEGEGMGGYEIRADSAAVTSRKSFIPLKVISENGVSVVAPGQRLEKGGKTLELAATEVEETLIQLDELQALADLLSPAGDFARKK